MTIKPSNVEMAFLAEWSTKEDIVRYHYPRHQQRVSHLITGALTTDGVQWSAITCSTAITTKSTNYKTVGSTYTIKWPGLEGFYADGLEAGLTCGIRGSTAAGTTVGYSWQYKDDDASTWQNLTTFKAFKASTLTYTERTVSGYASLGTGYNKLPMEIRLQVYTKAAKSRFKIKSSSYVAIMPKKST